jgi:DNA-binding PadR family transcriptional regulator
MVSRATKLAIDDPLHGWQLTPRRAAVLSAMAEGEASTGEIARRLHPNTFLAGEIYALLLVLEDRGLVESRWQPGCQRTCRLYRLTELGKAQVAHGAR